MVMCVWNMDMDTDTCIKRVLKPQCCICLIKKNLIYEIKFMNNKRKKNRKMNNKLNLLKNLIR